MPDSISTPTNMLMTLVATAVASTVSVDFNDMNTTYLKNKHCLGGEYTLSMELFLQI